MPHVIRIGKRSAVQGGCGALPRPGMGCGERGWNRRVPARCWEGARSGDTGRCGAVPCKGEMETVPDRKGNAENGTGSVAVPGARRDAAPRRGGCFALESGVPCPRDKGMLCFQRGGCCTPKKGMPCPRKREGFASGEGDVVLLKGGMMCPGKEDAVLQEWDDDVHQEKGDSVSRIRGFCALEKGTLNPGEGDAVPQRGGRCAGARRVLCGCEQRCEPAAGGALFGGALTPTRSSPRARGVAVGLRRAGSAGSRAEPAACKVLRRCGGPGGIH